MNDQAEEEKAREAKRDRHTHDGLCAGQKG
jgi:hypothetical protein